MYLRQVPRKAGAALAEKHNMPYFEVSARTSQNVDQAFERIASDVVQRLQFEQQTAPRAQEIASSETVDLTKDSSPQPRKACCS